MALTKARMISKISELPDFDNKKAAKSVEKIIEIIKSTLASDDDVLVSGFGKFSVKEKHERKGRNPATGDALMLESRKRVNFKCSGKLRERVNEKR